MANVAAIGALKQANAIVQIPIVDAVEVDAEGDVEAVLDIYSTLIDQAAKDRMKRDWQLLQGRVVHCKLVLETSGTVLNPDFTIDSVSGGLDSSRLSIVLPDVDAQITGDGRQEFNFFGLLGLLKFLRLDATVTTLDGSNKTTLLATLEVSLPDQSLDW